MNIYIIAGIVLLLLAVLRLFWLELKKFKVVHYTIPMRDLRVLAKRAKGKDLKRVCRFAFLADLHNNSFGAGNERLIAAIDREKPDFIVSAGDMLVAKPGRSMDTAIHLIKELADRYPIYYGNGNHEYRMRIYPKQYGDMYQQYKAVLDACAVHHLENESETLKINGHTLNICGLEIDRRYYKRFNPQSMEEDYISHEVGKKPNLFTILIAHNPDYFPNYVKWGAELTLSGHVHGGLVRLPKVGGLFSPQIRFFPKYDGGVYKSDGKTMILSRGLGTHTIPLRIFNRAELVIVDLADCE